MPQGAAFVFVSYERIIYEKNTPFITDNQKICYTFAKNFEGDAFKGYTAVRSCIQLVVYKGFFRFNENFFYLYITNFKLFMRMKRLLTFLTLLTVFFGVGWAETSSLIFTAKCNGSGTADDGTVWTVTSDGTESTFEDERGIHYGTNKAAVQYIKLSTSGISGTITKVVVNASTASGVSATASVTVGGNAFGGDPQSLSTTATDYTFNGSASGEIVVTVTKPSKATKALYVKSVVVTYTTGSSTPICNEPTFSPAAGTYYEPVNVTLNCATTGATIRYTLDGTDPTATTGTVYTSPISVTSTTTIKAIATADGMDPSSVASATYTIFEPETVTPTYEQSLISGFGKFYYVDKTNPTTSAIWKSNNYGAVASGQISGTKYDTESWLYTPYIDLTNATNPELSFSHAGNFFQTYMQTDAQVKVRVLNGTEWSEWSDLAISTWPNGTSWDFVDNTTSLLTYAGKKIQIAFKYTSSTSRAGSWEIKNFKVQDVVNSGDLYILGMVNGNGERPDQGVKMTYANGTYSAKIWVIGNSDNAMGVPGTWFAFTTVLAENNDNGGWGYVNQNRYSPTPSEGDYYWLTNGTESNITLTKQNNDKAFLIPAGLYEITVSGDLSKFSLTSIKNLKPTITPEGGEVLLNSTATIALAEDFNDFIADCNPVVTYAGSPVSITAPVAKLFVNDNAVEGTSSTYTFSTAGSTTITGKGALVVNGNDQYAAKTNSQNFTVVEPSEGSVYTLVTSVADLDETSEYVLFPKGSNNESGRVMSTTRQTNNIKGSETVTTVINNEISVPADAQVITLVKTTATVDGNNVDAWMLSVGDGYLYAASNSSNYMKVSTTADDKCKATIAIDGNAEIVFRGDYSHNVLRYNTGDNLYSCYESGKQNPVYLYKKGASTPSDKVATPVINPGSANSSNPYIVYGGKQQVAITCATEGATVYYTINGDEPTTSSTQYTGEPFDLTSAGGNMTVKAIAVKEGLENSAVATAYYLFKSPNAPTFAPTATTQSGDFDITINTEYEDGVIYYMLDPASAPTATNLTENGTQYSTPVAVTGEGEHTIYAVVVLNGIKSSVASETYTITSGETPVGDGDYVKVTSNANLTSGEYLIVYELEGESRKYGFLFDGSLSTLDAIGNSYAGEDLLGVDILDYTIEATSQVDARIFTIDVTAGTIKSASGYYIGNTSNSNSLQYSTTDVYTNTISIDNDGNAVIVSSGGAYLRYNSDSSQDRFRYFKSASYSNQKPIALYKKVDKPVEQPTSITLRELCATGEPGKTYTISDVEGLLGVYSQRTSVWFKDEAQAVDYQEPQASDKDYAIVVDENDLKINKNQKEFAQNNWIEVVFPAEADYNNKYVKNLTGTYSNVNGNPVLTLTQAVAEEDVTPVPATALAYEPNPYIAANFVGNQKYQGDTYFFSMPKAQEYAQILWAVWDGSKMNMPTDNNVYGFTGSFPIEPDLNISSFDGLQNGKAYNFHAIIHKGAATTTGAPMLKGTGDTYVVYPTDLNPQIPTAINGVSVNGEVKSVKYVNVAGVVSDKPFSGVNIVVTEYTDGSRSTTKMLRK